RRVDDAGLEGGSRISRGEGLGPLTPTLSPQARRRSAPPLLIPRPACGERVPEAEPKVGEGLELQGQLRLKPSSSEAAQSIACSIVLPCCVHCAIIFGAVAWA